VNGGKRNPIHPLYRKTYRTDFEQWGREISAFQKILSQKADHIVWTRAGCNGLKIKQKSRIPFLALEAIPANFQNFF
jgi:hypothetical protein